jgi:carboxyl-terminal processing protease
VNPSVDAKTPLVILTNNNTISAAEIFSGAIQDLDRGLIIGQKTFGKGLVGMPFNMGSGSKAIITVAYYYTPSGRCIQSRRYAGFAQSAFLNSTDHKKFLTTTGRKISDRDGITPDIFVEMKSPSPVNTCLSDSNLIFDWATQYTLAHPNLPKPAKFRLSDKELNQFLASIQGMQCQYTTQTEYKIEELRRASESEGYFSSIQPVLKSLEEKIKMEKQKAIQLNKEEIRHLLEEEIASRYYYEEGRFESRLKDDNVVKRAIEALHNEAEYRKLLGLK